MFLSMPAYSSEAVTTRRGSDPVLTALFWVVVCSPKGERNKGRKDCDSGLVAEREVPCAEQPKQTPLKQSREAAERSLLALQPLCNSSYMVFFSFFVFPGSRREAEVGFPPGLPPSPASGIPWGALLAQARRREGCFSQVCLEFVTTC